MALENYARNSRLSEAAIEVYKSFNAIVNIPIGIWALVKSGSINRGH